MLEGKEEDRSAVMGVRVEEMEWVGEWRLSIIRWADFWGGQGKAFRVRGRRGSGHDEGARIGGREVGGGQRRINGSPPCPSSSSSRPRPPP